MTWLLTIILILDGQRIEQPSGLMINTQTCRLAGISMAYAIRLGTPDAIVGWRCDAPGVPA